MSLTPMSRIWQSYVNLDFICRRIVAALCDGSAPVPDLSANFGSGSRYQFVGLWDAVAIVAG